jgi:hypothetical protein
MMGIHIRVNEQVHVENVVGTVLRAFAMERFAFHVQLPDGEKKIYYMNEIKPVTPHFCEGPDVVDLALMLDEGKREALKQMCESLKEEWNS